MGDNNRYSHWNHCRWTNPDCTYGYQGQGDWRPQESAWHGCQHGSDSGILGKCCLPVFRLFRQEISWGRPCRRRDFRHWNYNETVLGKPGACTAVLRTPW
jgi:hypothetical protein